MRTIKYGHCEEREMLGGIQRIYRFENSNYGASVVCHEGSYSDSVGKWELAVLYNGELCYTTPITDDVIGWLSDDEVQKILAQIDTLRDPHAFPSPFCYWFRRSVDEAPESEVPMDRS